jgi:YD repeat-containing protein
MIGYKATYNYKCRGQLYEIGKEYKMDHKPILCTVGFHYCKAARSVLRYYDYSLDFKLLEIDDLSEDTDSSGDKSCTNHIKIIREITDPDELLNLLNVYYAFNKMGNILTYKHSNGFSQQYTYDEHGHELTCKESSGYWRERTYDENGRELTFRNSNGYWREYSYNGSEISWKDSFSRETVSHE